MQIVREHPEQERKKRKKNYASSKKLLTSIKEKGPLGSINPKHFTILKLFPRHQ